MFATGVRLAIKLEQDGSVRAGVPLKGQVIVTLKKQFVSGQPLVLYLLGQELSNIQSGKRKTYASRKLTELNFTLVNSIALEPGVYTYRFEIPIDPALPASLRANNSRGGAILAREKDLPGCWIEYNLSAHLGKTSTKVKLNMLSAPLTSEKEPVVMQPVSHSVKKMGGLLGQKGDLIIGAYVPNANTARGSGQKIKVCIACHNNSEVDLENIEATIIEKIRQNTGPNGYNVKRKKVLVAREQLHIPELLTTAGKKTESTSLSIQDVQQHLFKDLSSGKYAFEVGPVPLSSQESYGGQLIQTEHYIKITLKTSGLTSGNPVLKIPLRVGRAGGSLVPQVATNPPTMICSL